jgi:hypothetical protein
MRILVDHISDPVNFKYLIVFIFILQLIQSQAQVGAGASAPATDYFVYPNERRPVLLNGVQHLLMCFRRYVYHKISLLSVSQIMRGTGDRQRDRLVRIDTVFAFPGPAPPAATESDGHLDVRD